MARQFFKDLPDTSTPLTASRLNGLLDGEETMGNLVVESIRSKNILDISSFSTQTINGITFTNNGDGTITINGTATDTFGISIATPKLKANTYYMTISAVVPTNFYIYDFNSSTEIMHINTATTLTQNYNNTAFGTFITNGTTFNNITIYPQLEIGTTATSFSPYQQLGNEDTGWIELQTEQGFTPTSWNKLKYRKKNGIVCIIGSVDLTEATSWTKLITTLPEGCRPPTELDIYCRASNSGYPFMVAVNADGTIRTLSEIITGNDAGSGTIFIFLTFIS